MAFNLVDLIKDQVTDSVLETAGGLLGGDDAHKVASGVESAVPALLGGLTGAAASAPEKASVLFDTINKADDNLLTHFGGVLGGSNAGKLLGQGTSVLNGLMGSDMVDKLGSAVSSATGMSSSGSGSLMSMLVSPILGVLKKKVVGDGLDAGGMMSMLNDQKANIANAMPSGLMSQLGDIGGFPSLSGLAGGVKDAAGNAVDAAGGAVSSATAGLGAAAGGVAAAAGGAVSAAGAGLGAAADKVGDVAQGGIDAVGGAAGKVGDIAQGGIDAAGNAVGRAGDAIGGAAQSGIDAVSGAAGKVGDMAQGGIDAAGNAVGRAGDAIGGAAQSGMDAVGGAAGKVGDMAQGGVDAVGNAAGRVGDAVGDVAQGGMDAVGSAAGKVGDVAGGAVDSVQAGVGAAADKVGDVAQSGAEAASGGLGWLKWLLPLIILLGLGWFAYNYFVKGDMSMGMGGAATDATSAVQGAVGDVNVEELSGNVSGMFGKATEALSGITDADSATAALPGLEELSGQVSGLPAMFDKVPEAARGPLQGVVSEGLGSLQPIVDKAMALPGVGGILEPVLKPMMETLGGLKG